MVTRKPLTKAELEEARRLRDLWDARKRPLRLTQESLAEKLGITQGAVNQYFRGRIRIGAQVLLNFAKHLKFDPRDVRPSIYEEIPLITGDLSRTADDVMDLILSLPPDVQGEVLARLAREFASNRK